MHVCMFVPRCEESRDRLSGFPGAVQTPASVLQSSAVSHCAHSAQHVLYHPSCQASPALYTNTNTLIIIRAKEVNDKSNN